MPQKCEIYWLAAGDLTLCTRPESRREYEACQSDSKMQDQLKRDENGITLSAYTLEKLSRSMWNKPEARSRHQLWFWEIQLRQKCSKSESESVDRGIIGVACRQGDSWNESREYVLSAP